MSRDTRVPERSGTRPGSSVDREAWAKEVQSLLGAETGGNLTAFARLVGTNRRTVNRWLGQDVDVREESVRQVARALNLPVGDLLVKVGWLDPGDLTIQTATANPPREDAEAIQAVQASDVKPAVRRKLLAHLRAAREQHEKQRLADIQRMLGLLMGGRR